MINVDNLDIFNYLRIKNYILTCPGINGYVLVDRPSVDDIVSQLSTLSGQEISKRELYSLLESRNVLLPSQVAGDIRSKVAYLKAKDDEDRRLTFIQFLISRDMVLPSRTDGDPRDSSSIVTYSSPDTKWCLVVPKHEAMAAVNASLTKRRRPSMHPSDFDLEMRNANVVVSERFEKAFMKAGRIAISERLKEIRQSLNVVEKAIKYNDDEQRSVITGKRGYVCEDKIHWLVLCLYVKAISQRQFSDFKKKLRFMRLLKDDWSDGQFCLDRSPTVEEAEIIRKVVGLSKVRVLSDDRIETLKQQVSTFNEKREVPCAKNALEPSILSV